MFVDWTPGICDKNIPFLILCSCDKTTELSSKGGVKITQKPEATGNEGL